jgi:HTH-type transcriptional regulator/antitoxin HigA
MEIKVIKTEKDYQMALRRLDAIFDAHLDSQNADELEMLSLLIDKYEEEKFPIDLL